MRKKTHFEGLAVIRNRQKNHSLGRPMKDKDFGFCKIRPWTRSDLGIGCMVSFSVPISTLKRKENYYSNREVDELENEK